MLGTGETRRELSLRRHGVAAFLVSASLLWGAGFAQIEDGRVAPPLGGVVAAVASEAESSSASERLRNSTAPRHAADRIDYG
jgi:hypothetical protein